MTKESGRRLRGEVPTAAPAKNCNDLAGRRLGTHQPNQPQCSPMPIDVVQGTVVEDPVRDAMVPVVHSVRGFLGFCQNQLPDMDDGDDIYELAASFWKQVPQETRRWWDEEAAKNKPHPGDGGPNSGYPCVTPHETEVLLSELANDIYGTPWNLAESDDA